MIVFCTKWHRKQAAVFLTYVRSRRHIVTLFLRTIGAADLKNERRACLLRNREKKETRAIPSEKGFAKRGFRNGYRNGYRFLFRTGSVENVFNRLYPSFVTEAAAAAAVDRAGAATGARPAAPRLSRRRRPGGGAAASCELGLAAAWPPPPPPPPPPVSVMPAVVISSTTSPASAVPRPFEKTALFF